MIPTMHFDRFPLLKLLNPGRQTALLAVSLAIGFAAAIFVRAWIGAPLWVASAIVLASLLPTIGVKFLDDRRHLGVVPALLGGLLIAQGLHSIEHIVQWVQYHVLNLTLRDSNGLLSPANAEWVHFVWNWLVLGCVIVLVYGGMRNPWGWAILVVAAMHTGEHSYLFLRYQEVLAELGRLGITNVTAQSLPGILGRDGWLARSPLTQNTILCGLPGLTTATRLDVHFWWNVIELSVLIPAAHIHLSKNKAPSSSPEKAGTAAEPAAIA